jgi:hypothetical protein
VNYLSFNNYWISNNSWLSLTFGLRPSGAYSRISPLVGGFMKDTGRSLTKSGWLVLGLSGHWPQVIRVAEMEPQTVNS